MTDKNIKLHAAFLYWLDTCCRRTSTTISCYTKGLLDDFNYCMEQTGLSLKLGMTAFELMLEYSGFEKYEQDGETYWRGVDTIDPLAMTAIVDSGFPEILS